ncbi:heavy metal sensor histidine kinase [Achromobacter aloeverae]
MFSKIERKIRNLATRQRSIAERLSIWLAIQTFSGLAIVCAAVYVLTNSNLERRQQSLLQQKMEVVRHLVAETLTDGNTPRLHHKLADFFYGRSDFSLKLNIAGEQFIYGKVIATADVPGAAPRISFDMPAHGMPDGVISAQLVLDTSADHWLQDLLKWTLLACAMSGAIVVSAIGVWLVRRGLAPLDELGRQASQLSPERMGQRLRTTNLDRELRPLVGQFNLLLQRLERAYTQMEGFNSDVAHELRTPIANLTCEIELALSARSEHFDVQELLGSNLEELQRLAGIVNDMLFLSQVDRGVKARGNQVPSLAALAQEVADYHEAEALDRNVQIAVAGDADAIIDKTLVQRALSNLVSNAVRYAEPNTRIEISIRQPDQQHVAMAVRNMGETIDPKHLSRLFHRFYRADEARCFNGAHHGLGLAIVAAIARMHGGNSFVESKNRATVVGFKIPREPEAS